MNLDDDPTPFGGHLKPKPVSPVNDLLLAGWRFEYSPSTSCVHGIEPTGSKRQMIRIYHHDVQNHLGEAIAAWMNGGRQ